MGGRPYRPRGLLAELRGNPIRRFEWYLRVPFLVVLVNGALRLAFRLDLIRRGDGSSRASEARRGSAPFREGRRDGTVVI